MEPISPTLVTTTLPEKNAPMRSDNSMVTAFPTSAAHAGYQRRETSHPAANLMITQGQKHSHRSLSDVVFVCYLLPAGCRLIDQANKSIYRPPAKRKLSNKPPRQRSTSYSFVHAFVVQNPKAQGLRAMALLPFSPSDGNGYVCGVYLPPLPRTCHEPTGKRYEAKRNSARPLR